MNIIIAQLYDFSRLPPNTQLIKHEEGNFAKSKTYYRTNKTDENDKKLADDITEFVNKLLIEIKKECPQDQNDRSQAFKTRSFRKLIVYNRHISHALNGTQEKGGLNGLLDTYYDKPVVMEPLVIALEKLRIQSLEHLKVLRDQLENKEDYPDENLTTLTTYHLTTEEKVYCPEKFFTDDEWEEAIELNSSLRVEDVSLLRYYGLYVGGLYWNRYQSYWCPENWSWMNEIATYNDTKLWLGALPIITSKSAPDSHNDLEIMKSKGIKAVLSIIEVFENHSNLLEFNPVRPSNYSIEGIKHLQIPTQDMKTIYFEFIERGVEYIRWNLDNKRPVYVHCKAGRGRSVLTVVCFLIKYRGMTADAAYNEVKKHRPQAGFEPNRNEWKTLRKYEELYLQKT